MSTFLTPDPDKVEQGAPPSSDGTLPDGAMIEGGQSPGDTPICEDGTPDDDMELAPVEDNDKRRRIASKRDAFMTILLFLIAIGLFLVRASMWQEATDPRAFRDLVYSRSINNGLGFTWMGAPFIAWNNLIWAIMVSIGGVITDDLELVARYFGIIWFGLSMCLMLFWSYDLFGRYWPGALAAILLAGHPSTAAAVLGGSDAALLCALIILVFWLYGHEVRSGVFLRSTPAWFFLMLARPALAPLAMAALLMALPIVARRPNKIKWGAFFLWVVGVSVSIFGAIQLNKENTFGSAVIALHIDDMITGFSHLVASQTPAFYWSLPLMALICWEKCPIKLGRVFLHNYLLAFLLFIILINTNQRFDPSAESTALLALTPFAFLFASGAAMLLYHRPYVVWIRSIYYFGLCGYLILIVWLHAGLATTSHRFGASSWSQFMNSLDPTYLIEHKPSATNNPHTMRQARFLRREGTVRNGDRWVGIEAGALTYWAEHPIFPIPTDWRKGATVLPPRPDMVILPVRFDGEGFPYFYGDTQTPEIYYWEGFRRTYTRLNRATDGVFIKRPEPLEGSLVGNIPDIEIIFPKVVLGGSIQNGILKITNTMSIPIPSHQMLRDHDFFEIDIFIEKIDPNDFAREGSEHSGKITIQEGIAPKETGEIYFSVTLPEEPGNYTLGIGQTMRSNNPFWFGGFIEFSILDFDDYVAEKYPE